MSAEKNQAVRIVSANEAGNRFVPEKCINIQAEFLDDPHPLVHEVPDTFIQTGIFSSPKLRVCLYGQLNGEPVLVPVSERKTSFGTTAYKEDRERAESLMRDWTHFG